MNVEHEQGFTLLEVLVALVILIAGLAAFYEAFGGGLLAGAAAERERNAVEAAENLIAEIGRSRPVEEGLTTGELPDGQRWTLRVEAFDPVETDRSTSPVAGYIATLEVLPRLGSPVRVQTLILGVKPR